MMRLAVLGGLFVLLVSCEKDQGQASYEEKGVLRHQMADGGEELDVELFQGLKDSGVTFQAWVDAKHAIHSSQKDRLQQFVGQLDESFGVVGSIKETDLGNFKVLLSKRYTENPHHISQDSLNISKLCASAGVIYSGYTVSAPVQPVTSEK